MFCCECIFTFVCNLFTQVKFPLAVLKTNCIVFIDFYSASHSMSLSEALPPTAIDTVSEFTRRSAIQATVSEGLAHRGVQYVHCAMHKCIMVKVGGNEKHTKYVNST